MIAVMHIITEGDSLVKEKCVGYETQGIEKSSEI